MYLDIKDGILSGSETEIFGDFVIPDGVKEIAAHAFFFNLGINSVVFPPTVERIGAGAFEDCDNILKAVIPENAKIGFYAFYGCDLLITNLSIKQWKGNYGIRKQNYAINYIRCYQSGDPFFDSVKEENNIYIKNNLISLIKWFSGDEIYFINYVTREIPLDIDRVEALLDKFSGNVEAAAVLLDYKKKNFSEEYLEKRAAERTEKELGLRPRTVADWRKIFALSDDKNGGYIIKKYKGKDTDIIIPDTIGKRRVTEIGKGAFSPLNNNDAEVFGNIQNIRAVYIPESITKIDNHAFWDCSNLEEIEIPSSVTSIGNYAFAYCKSLTSVTIPDSVKSIGASAFAYCSGLTEITLPGFLTEMGNNLFQDCVNLTKAVISKGITALPEQCFSYCRNLAEVRLPDGIAQLGLNAFSDCEALSHITLPSSVRDISTAFSECPGLEELTIPEGVTRIYIEAFCKTARLKKITLPDTITEIGVVAFEQSGITSIKIPSGVTAIAQGTFRECGYLDYVEIPASVTYISPDAFYLASANMVISAPRGSYAIEYAKENGFKFKELQI